ncbi:hypothetical protein K438DRAFT_1773860 [Mycena galopus ATCC 62051]|nr:hypothetical protein K438DRAFT_1773860 [Mycena galopus ATCC 62051]
MSFTRAIASTARPLARSRLAATRTFTSAPPPPPPSPAKKSGGNGTTYLIGAVLAGAAGYYYYTQNPQRVDALAHKAKAEEELAVKHAKEMGNNAMIILCAKLRVATLRVVERLPGLVSASPLDLSLAAGQDRLAAARSTVNGSLKDARDATNKVVADADARAHKVASDAGAQYDAAKAKAQGGLSSARSSTESLYNDARTGTEKKTEEAKAGWFSWLGWGNKKVEEGKEKVEDGTDKLRKEGAKAAGDVQKKLDS